MLGTQRVDIETVISYSNINIGDIYTEELGNKALKDLFDTNLFDEMEFNPAYLIIIGRSFLLAVAATIISLIIGFPVAYYISRQRDSVKNILIF